MARLGRGQPIRAQALASKYRGINHDADSTAKSVSSASLAWSHTVGTYSGNRFLIVGVSLLNALGQTITGVTFGAANLTKLGALANGTSARVELWYLKNPNTGAGTITVTPSAAVALVAGATSWFGVDQTYSPLEFDSLSGSSSNPAITLEANPAQIIHDAVATIAATLTVGAGQTQRWNDGVAGIAGGGSTEPARPGTETTQWTASSALAWVIAATILNSVGQLPAEYSLPDNISTSEAFGTLAVSSTVTLSPSGIASSEAFGTLTISSTVTLTPDGITTSEAFGTAVISPTVTVTPDGTVTSETFGTATISSTVTLSPTALASSEAFGTLTVSPTVTLSPDGITSGEAFGSPPIIGDVLDQNLTTTGATSYSTASVVPTEGRIVYLMIRAHRSGTGPPIPTITGTGWASAAVWTQIDTQLDSATAARDIVFWTVCPASPTAGVVTFTFTGGNLNQCGWYLFDATVASTISPVAQFHSKGGLPGPGFTGTSYSDDLTNNVDNYGAIYAFIAHNSAEAAIVGANFIAIGVEHHGAAGGFIAEHYDAAVGTKTAAASWTTSVSYSGVEFEVFGGQVALAPTVTLSPDGIASTESFGTLAISGTVTITPDGIVSSEAFGTPSLSLLYTASPDGTISGEAFGMPTTSTTVTIVPDGIVPSETFGTPTISSALTITPDASASSEAFGTLAIATTITLSPDAIPSGEAFGTLTISSAVTISPIAIDASRDIARRNSFEGGTPGDVITPANSGGDSGDAFQDTPNSDTGVTYDTVHTAFGVRSMRVDTVSDSGRVEWDFTPMFAATTYIRAFITLSALPSNNSDVSLFDLISPWSGGIIHTLISVSTGFGGATAGLLYTARSAQLTTPVVAGQMFRLEFKMDSSGTQTSELRLFLDPYSDTPTETVIADDGGTSSISTMRAGITTDDSFFPELAWYDDLVVSYVDWIGPRIPSSFGALTVSAIITVIPDGTASEEAFGTLDILQAGQVVPDGLVSNEAFGDLTITTGATTVSPDGNFPDEIFGTLSISTVVTLSPTGIPTSEAFGTPVISSAVTLTPNGIVTSEAFGTLAISGVLTLDPSGITSSGAFGTLAVSATVTLSPIGIVSSEAFGVLHISTTGPTTVTPDGIASREAFGLPTVSVQGAPITLSPSSIVSSEAFGTLIAHIKYTMHPNGIASGQVLGVASVTTVVTIRPTGAVSREAFGLLKIGGQLALSPVGITSSEAEGAPTILPSLTVAPVGIASEEAVGLVLLLASVILHPDGEAFGAIGDPRIYRIYRDLVVQVGEPLTKWLVHMPTAKWFMSEPRAKWTTRELIK